MIIELDAQTANREVLTCIKSQLAKGFIIVLRNLGFIRELRRQIIAYSSAASNDPQCDARLVGFYEEGADLTVEDVHALTRAIKKVRSDRFISQLSASFLRQLGFEEPILLDGGIPRLVLRLPFVEEARASGLFARADFERERADGPTEMFMPGVSNIHRDFNREHDLFQCNLWFPFHDVQPSETVQIFPQVYRERIYDIENTLENRRKLGDPATFSLSFGDAVLFHGEHVHCSPDRNGSIRRHSYDLRIASSCLDDNRHYRDNFLNINNFLTKTAPKASLFETYDNKPDYLRHYTECGDFTPAVFYWLSIERSSISNSAARDVAAISKLFPFAEDRNLGLASHLGTVSAETARHLILEIAGKSMSYFWVLKAAEELLKLGSHREARCAFIRAKALGEKRSACFNFAPVPYQNPSSQMTPALVVAAAEQYLRKGALPTNRDAKFATVGAVYDRPYFVESRKNGRS